MLLHALRIKCAFKITTLNIKTALKKVSVKIPYTKKTKNL